MEEPSREKEKELTGSAKSARTRMSRHWQILFVDDHGKMVTVKWLKPFVMGLIVLLMVSLGVSITFLSFYMTGSAKTRAMQSRLKQSEERIKSLRYELDILMARVVLAESKYGFPGIKKTKEKAARPPDTASADKMAGKSTSRGDTPQGNSKKSKPLNPPGDVAGVLVKDLTITHEVPDNLLRVNLTVRNKKSDLSTVAGYIFVILKGNEGNQKGWFTIPSASLVDGRPDEIKKGQYFKISRYKTISFKVQRQMKPERFKIVSIYVYGPEGNMLFEETRPLTIKIVETRRHIKKEKITTTGTTEMSKEKERVEEREEQVIMH